jgi:hypothetical protein
LEEVAKKTGGPGKVTLEGDVIRHFYVRRDMEFPLNPPHEVKNEIVSVDTELLINFCIGVDGNAAPFRARYVRDTLDH